MPAAAASVPRALGLTRRGWTCAGAGAGLVVGSRVLGAGALAGLGLGALLLLGFALAWVWSRRPALAVARTVHPPRLHVGAEGRVVLHGAAATKTPLLTLTDEVDGGRRAARFVVAPLAAGAPIRAVYRFPTARRGRHLVGPLLATLTDPLGLARRRWVVADATDVVVCPRVHPVVAPRRAGGGEPAAHAEGGRTPALEPLGEFLSLRDYEPGDDPRRVHWRATARTGELIVRQDEAASPGRVVLVLDTRPDVHDARSFEIAVEAIASVAVRLRRDHAPLEVVTTAGEMLGRSGAGAVDVLLERLAVVEVGVPDHLRLVAAGLGNRLGIGAVVVATGTPDTSLAEAFAPLRARAVVTVVAGRIFEPGARWRALSVVDASIVPFRDAWNVAVPRHRTRWNAGSPSRSRSVR